MEKFEPSPPDPKSEKMKPTEKQHEMPKSPEKSPEEILAEKKEKLKSAIGLMLNFQLSQKIEKSLLPRLDGLTSEEVDYLSEKVRYLDNQVQLRGPFSATASEFLAESEKKLKEFEKNIGPDRTQELKNLLKGK